MAKKGNDVSETMTIEQVLTCAKSMKFYGHNKAHRALLEYADHLAAQPAQSVDVGAVREVIATLDCVGSAGSDHYSSEYLQDAINDASDKLSQAIGDKT